ncbi:MAG: hypothetical protein AB7I08_15155 [Thermoleophilia bacterium]
MHESQWQPLARLLAAAWPDPDMDPERSAVYLEVLDDLDAADVEVAVRQLLREDRETPPPPGVVRTRAVAVAAARRGTSSGTTPHALDGDERREPEVVPGLRLGLHPLAKAGGATNQRAIWGIVLGVVALLGPLLLRALIRTADPYSDPGHFPIEAMILSATAAYVSFTGWVWAKQNQAPKTVAVVALVLAGLASLLALGALGATINDRG